MCCKTINKYLQEHPEEMYNVLNDILSLLDTHSMYLSSEEYAQGFPTLESFVGIGVSMQQTADGVQIAEVMRYSSAEEAGLQAGDFIVAVDGTDTTAMTNADVAELLRGREARWFWSPCAAADRTDRYLHAPPRSARSTFRTRPWRTAWNTSGQRHGLGERLERVFRDLGRAG